jgi:predicted phage tail protein
VIPRGTVAVRVVRNVFEPAKTSIVYTRWRGLGEPIQAYAPPDLAGQEWVHVLHNGEALTAKSAGVRIPHEGDSLAFIVRPHGPVVPVAAIYGTIQTTATQALATSAHLAAAGYNPKAYAELAAGVTLAAVGDPTGAGYALIGQGLAEYGASIYGDLIGVPKLAKATFDEEFKSSPTYNLDGYRNTAINGKSIEVCYGKHRVAGQAIAQFTRVLADGTTNLHTLLSLGHGPLYSIGGLTVDTDGLNGNQIPEDFEIDGQPASNYSGIRCSVRLGTSGQTPIPGFPEIVDAHANGAELRPNEAQTLTTRNPVSAFEVNVFHPSGLFRLSGATVLDHEVEYRIRYREFGTTAWTSVTKTVTKDPGTQESFSSTHRVDAPLGAESGGGIKERIMEIEVMRLTEPDAPTEIATIVWKDLNEIRPGDLSYPGLALVGWEALASDQLEGTAPTFTTVAEGRMVPVWDGVSETAPTLTAQYTDGNDVLDLLDEAPILWQPLNPSTNATRIGQKFTQSGTRTILGVKAKMRRPAAAVFGASDTMFVQIVTDVAGKPEGSGIATSIEFPCQSVPRSPTEEEWAYFPFLTPVELTDATPYHIVFRASYATSATNHIEIALHDGTGYEVFDQTVSFWTVASSLEGVNTAAVYKRDKPGENPAWILLDLLLDKRYGLGPWVRLNDIDLASFLTWADYCDEMKTAIDSDENPLPDHRWALGLVLDSTFGAWELALKIAQLGRASLLKVGRRISVVIDKPGTTAQNFTTGNITQGSLSIQYGSINDRPNRIEIQYSNAATGYLNDVAFREDPAALAAGDGFRTKSINAFGITAKWRAERIAQFEFNVAKNIKKSCQFASSVNAATVIPGELVTVLHTIQQGVLYGGRANADAPGASLFLADQEVTIGHATKNTFIAVETSGTGGHVVQKRTVAAAGATPTTYPVGTNIPLLDVWDLGDHPAKYDQFAIYLEEDVTSAGDWRVIGTGLTGDGRTRFACVQYLEDVYDDA